MNELEIIHHRQIDGLSLFFDTVDYRTPHVHPEWELIWVLEQPLCVNCAAQRWVLQSGQMILFNPNEPHEFHKQGESCTFLCLQISPQILPAMLPVHVDGRLLHEHLSIGEMAQIQAAFGRILSAYLDKEDHFALTCVGEACLLLRKLLDTLPCHLRTQEETQSNEMKKAS